ncbi:hypothetical protein SEL4614_27940 [Salmonella enterica subsp. enterica serovar 4,[5],12:i:-]|uniref:Uncharacterized protein n=1 Tax=Salmonella enterica subsp. enterica serovar 4,[5],12:i:- TaxID=440524 RepID=A0A455RUH7_SALET|nr:hypothetical protein STL3838_29170 [Salmonella enterica subsp. enterica serovar 4,[5],12:i:-]BCI37189.1 hypothetical protein SEL4614_27940 [Salmonella enterica subsp. enterica serovar 4,[5],12:i:-]
MMRISEKGITLIKEFEGCSLKLIRTRERGEIPGRLVMAGPTLLTVSQLSPE